MTTAQNLRPSRQDAADGVFVAAIVALGLAGFRSAFGGWSYLVAGVIGIVAGLLVAHLVVRTKLSPVPALLAVLVTFIVIGAPVAGREDVVAGIIPTPQAFVSLVDGLVSGWRRLLTSLPPTGSLGNLLAVPYLIGFLGSVVGHLLARRTRLGVTLLAPGAAALATSILFGTRRPFSLVVQGALFGVTALAWLAVRSGRQRERIVVTGGRRRLVASAAMLGVIGSVGFVTGPHLPFAEASDRVVLRADPPFDPRQFGSPLNSFQRFLIGDELEDATMFRLVGLPAADTERRIRLAAMDDYDGVVWRVGSGSTPGAAEFIRVGEEIPTDAIGDEVAVTFDIEALPGIWVPSVGEISGIRWPGGGRSERLRDLFRLSRRANTAAIAAAGGWQIDDEYTLSGVLVPRPPEESLRSASIDTNVSLGLTRGLPDDLAALAATITKGKATPYEQAVALESWFKQGYYKNGDEQPGVSTNAPGHSIARLQVFVKNDIPIGNAEQYAAAMALFARSLGLPARVVMGFRLAPGATEVLGSDVDAWVEIAFEGLGWVPFVPTPYDNTSEPEIKKKRQRQQFESMQVPPPPIAPPTPETPMTEEGRKKDAPPPPDADEELAPPATSRFPLLITLAVAIPIAVVVLPVVTILSLKWRRRRRRRKHRDPVRRAAAGWLEAVDTAVDAGIPLAKASTRNEAAVALGTTSAETLARSTDAVVFGPGTPDDETVEALWSAAKHARREILAPLSPVRRIRARLNTASLRRAI